MANAYLEKRKTEYRALVEKITKAQADAAKEGATVTDEQFRAAKEDRDAALKLADEIKELQEFETRAAAVGELAADVTDEDGGEGEEGGTDDDTHHRAKSGTKTKQRDPGHYRSVAERGNRSFFADLFNAGKFQNADSIKRLAEHTAFMRAAGPVTQAGGGLGIVPPKWLTDEYLKMGRQGRVVAKLVRQIPLGEDPRALVLPKQTAQVDADMTAQTSEGANNAGWGDPLFATNDDTLTPTAQAAYQDVSRQLLASGTPAADVLIMGDLHDAWDFKAEKLVCATCIAAATTSTTFATQTLFKANTGVAIDAVVDAQTAAASALYGPADIAIMSYFEFGAFRKLKDGNNRPLMPVSRYSPQNAAGALDNVLVGDIEGVDAYATNGVIRNGAVETITVLRSQTVLFAESDLLEFNYEQVVGPSAVRMGIFGYLGAFARVPAAIQSIVVTSATT